MYGSTYVVFYGPESGNFGAVVSRRIEAPTFVAVEDWAHEHAPEGYQLSSIEKVYGSADWLGCFGPVEADLHEGVADRQAVLDREYGSRSIEELRTAWVDLRGTHRGADGIYRTCFTSEAERASYIERRLAKVRREADETLAGELAGLDLDGAVEAAEAAENGSQEPTGASTKVVGLTVFNVNALREIAPRLEQAGISIETTATTATLGASPREALGAVETIMADYPGRHTVRHSLHAVRRKLAKQVQG